MTVWRVELSDICSVERHVDGARKILDFRTIPVLCSKQELTGFTIEKLPKARLPPPILSKISSLCQNINITLVPLGWNSIIVGTVNLRCKLLTFLQQKRKANLRRMSKERGAENILL